MERGIQQITRRKRTHKSIIMKPIHTLIGFTEAQYEDIILDTMLQWADIYGDGSPKKTQILLANRHINNWFRVEMRKLLKMYRTYLEPYENVPGITTQERRTLFLDVIEKIFDIYPKALMTQQKFTEVKAIKQPYFINN